MNETGNALRVVVITGSDSFLRAIEIRDGIGDSYQKRAAVVWLSPDDLKRLDIVEGVSVELRNAAGSVVVRAKSDATLDPGTAFMRESLYSLCLIGYEPGSGIFNLQRIEATVVPASGEITPVSEIQGI